jgi:hypothetical protein
MDLDNEPLSPPTVGFVSPTKKRDRRNARASADKLHTKARNGAREAAIDFGGSSGGAGSASRYALRSDGSGGDSGGDGGSGSIAAATITVVGDGGSGGGGGGAISVDDSHAWPARKAVSSPTPLESAASEDGSSLHHTGAGGLSVGAGGRRGNSRGPTSSASGGGGGPAGSSSGPTTPQKSRSFGGPVHLPSACEPAATVTLAAFEAFVRQATKELRDSASWEGPPFYSTVPGVVVGQLSCLRCGSVSPPSAMLVTFSVCFCG